MSNGSGRIGGRRYQRSNFCNLQADRRPKWARLLTAKASYTDGHGANKMAEEDSAVCGAGNGHQTTTAPEFKDDDGDALTSVDRSVAENTAAGEDVGA